MGVACFRCAVVCSPWPRDVQAQRSVGDGVGVLCAMRCADVSNMALVLEQPSAHSSDVYSVGFSPDGTRIVSGSTDRSVKVWGGCRLLSLCCRVHNVSARCAVGSG